MVVAALNDLGPLARPGGAFGAFGSNGDGPHDWRRGASGDHTAFSNSTLCGNPQGSAGVLDDHTN